MYALIAAHLATLVLNWREDGEIYEERRSQNKEVSVSMSSLVRGVRLGVIVSFTVFDISYALYNHYTGVDVTTGWVVLHL